MARARKTSMTPAEYRTNMREDQIQVAVIQQLERFAPVGATWCHVPNGGKRGAVEAARMKGQGVMPGWPDLQIFYAGDGYFLELKTAKGRLSPSQKIRLFELDMAGQHTAVAYGLDDAIRILKEWGLITSKPRLYGDTQLPEAAE